MRVTVELDNALVREVHRQAPLLADLCEVAVKANLLLGPVPSLYGSQVRFRPEEPGTETLALWDVVLSRGYGDCAHLSAWRAAYLRQNGEPRARVRVLGRQLKSGRMFHAIVQRQNGSFEDPSAILGMKV